MYISGQLEVPKMGKVTLPPSVHSMEPERSTRVRGARSPEPTAGLNKHWARDLRGLKELF